MRHLRHFLSMAIAYGILQAFIINPNTNMPAYIDPQYNLDGRSLQQNPAPSGITIYDAIVRQGHSQDIWVIRPQGDNTATIESLIIEDED